MHTITSIGDSLTAQEVDIFISNLLSYKMIETKEAKLLKVATSDNVLNVPQKLQIIYHELKLLNIGKKTII